MSRRATDEFEAAIEAARLGTVFASNLVAYNRWRAATVSRQQAPTDDAKVEAQIARLASLFPDQIIRGTI